MMRLNTATSLHCLRTQKSRDLMESKLRQCQDKQEAQKHQLVTLKKQNAALHDDK